MNHVVKRTITALILAAVVVCALIYIPLSVLIPLVCVFAILALIEYAQLLMRKVPLQSPQFILFFVIGALLLCAGFVALPLIASKFGNLMLLYIVSIVKMSDMGGFAFGLSSQRLMKNGNHKLCPTISPNKSWEGLGGSIFGSCLISCCFMPITQFGWGASLLLGVMAALVGTFGDLVESKFKRWVDVKDSSTMKLTNGMGGFLDMFDSLIFAPAILFVLLSLWR